MMGDTFLCWHCNQGFPDKRQLEIHIKIEHGELVFGQSEWFGCRLCYNTLYCRRQDIIKHMRNAHQEEIIQAEDYLIKSAEDINLPCQECGELNLFSKLCKDHVVSPVTEVYACTYCDEDFSDAQILKAHVNIEHGKLVYADAKFECYQCHQCGSELYLGSDAFQSHMRQYHGDESVNLNSHVVKCLEDIVTECNLCQSPCVFSMFCKRHDAEVSLLQCDSHTQHNCTFCSAAFVNCQLLWKHQFAVHSGESLVCNLCEKSADSMLIRSPISLVKHWRQRHWKVGDQKYKCSHCHVKLMSLEQVRQHLDSMHCGKQKSYTESESGDENNITLSFEYRTSYLDKDQFKFTEGDQVKYKCSECEKSYTRFYELKCHLMVHKGERNLMCTICDKSFYQGSRLTEHYKRSHHMKVTRVNELKRASEISIEGVTKYKCPNCPSITSRFDSLQQHMRSHTGERPFSCEVCGKTFVAREHLKRHFNNIHMRVGYQCNICGRILTDSSNLKVHMRNHTGEKKYVCEVCGKGFSQWASHHYHKFTHNEERPFTCPFCPMNFRCPRTLAEHKKTHVISDVKHVCDTCGSEFNTRKNLLSHVKIHVAGRPHQCEVCSAKFKLRKYLIQHMKTHKTAASVKLESSIKSE